MSPEFEQWLMKIISLGVIAYVVALVVGVVALAIFIRDGRRRERQREAWLDDYRRRREELRGRRPPL